ncbi:MAG TPA: energy transducer TonB [Vicinamibacterales bacterium]
MSTASLPAAEVFSVREIARAAGVPTSVARRVIGSAREYLGPADAVRFVRMLRGAPGRPAEREIFAPPLPAHRSPAPALAASGGLHVAALGLALLVFGLSSAADLPQRLEPARLVFLATAGPGGGGGGGGLKQPAPPPKAQLKSASRLKSPVPPPRVLTSRKPEPEVKRTPPPAVTPKPAPVDPPAPPKPVVTPQVVAPVVTESSDPQDRAGVLSESKSQAESQGMGTGGGVGTGQGSGIGEGAGAGIGPGSGGGTGGGPYRPGAGITPPQLLQEIRPDYTEEARRAGVEGDVLLEIVVRRDGTVGDVKIVKGLGGGLDRRAVDAVRRWRFAPAQRFGTPVDVMVEVAVEFKLR